MCDVSKTKWALQTALGAQLRVAWVKVRYPFPPIQACRACRTSTSVLYINRHPVGNMVSITPVVFTFAGRFPGTHFMLGRYGSTCQLFFPIPPCGVLKQRPGRDMLCYAIGLADYVSDSLSGVPYSSRKRARTWKKSLKHTQKHTLSLSVFVFI